MYRTSNGVVVTDPSLIEDAISNDFRMRFVANDDCLFDENVDFDFITLIIFAQENHELTKGVSAEEIKDNAVFDLALDKSSGPDGFPPFFF